MLMKKYLILFIITFIFAGCNNDDFNNETPYNATDIVGEWLFYEDINKSYVTNLTLNSNSTLETYLYRYPGATNYISEVGSGIWTFSRSTKNLESRVTYLSSQQIKTNNYTIENVDEYSLKMYDKQLHSHDTYIRVVNSYNLFMDEKLDMKDMAPDFNAYEYESLNQNIASVNNEGIITCTGIGTTFIIAKDGDKKLAVRINVSNGISRHSSEVNSNIASIIKKYGNNYIHLDKDKIGYGLSIIAYKKLETEPCAQELQYHYEPYSGSIVCIETIYESEKSLQNDLSYLRTHYKYLNLPTTTLYVSTDITNFSDSDYYIMPLTNGIRYGSTNFLNKYHYANAWGYTIPGLFDN